MFECGNFIDTATQSPDIRLVVVGLVREELWAHVVGCAYDCAGQIIGALQHTSDAQIPDLRGVDASTGHNC